MSFLNLFRDPPPEFAFEVASNRIAAARTKPPQAIREVPLAPGVVTPSPVRQNVQDFAAFSDSLRKLVPPGRGRKRAALILPDNAVRVAVLEFDRIPEKPAELRSLLNLRLRKSVPFDIDEAALSWFAQKGNRVLAAFAPVEIVAHYERPFREGGFEPGLVTVSSIAMLDLLPQTGSCLVARRSPESLTLMAIESGAVTIARSLEVADEEIASGIYTTIAFIEDQGGRKPEKLLTWGIAQTDLPREIEMEVEPIAAPHPGLSGYLNSLALRTSVKAAAA